MDYYKQAQDFLKRFGIEYCIGKCAEQTGPMWLECRQHGVKYRVMLTKDAGSIVFPFWGSIADKKNGVHPSAYAVLACVAGDCHCPETFEDFCAEYGDDTDSRKAYATWRRCLAFSKKLRAFFTEGEIDALQEIQ